MQQTRDVALRCRRSPLQRIAAVPLGRRPLLRAAQGRRRFGSHSGSLAQHGPHFKARRGQASCEALCKPNTEAVPTEKHIQTSIRSCLALAGSFRQAVALSYGKCFQRSASTRNGLRYAKTSSTGKITRVAPEKSPAKELKLDASRQLCSLLPWQLLGSTFWSEVCGANAGCYRLWQRL